MDSTAAIEDDASTSLASNESQSGEVTVQLGMPMHSTSALADGSASGCLSNPSQGEEIPWDHYVVDDDGFGDQTSFAVRGGNGC